MEVKVKILGLSATVVKDGNCDTMVKKGLEYAKECGEKVGGGVETEFLTLADKDIRMCKNCQWCIENRQPCAKIDDDAIAVWQKISECDGLLIGSPTWTLTLAPLYGILNSRARYYAFFSQDLRNKVVGFMTVGFLGYGLETSLDQLYHMTGGGLLNLKRLNEEMGFNTERWPEPQGIFEKIKNAGNIPEEEMYKTFNMGIGFCVVVSKGIAVKALDILDKENPTVLGHATKGNEIIFKKEIY